VQELMASSFVLEKLFTTSETDFLVDTAKIFKVTAIDLGKISQLKTPNKVVALFQISKEEENQQENQQEQQREKQQEETGLIVALDEINDPGNLGTIIRLCDWFGVSKLVCSKGTVDCYNQKVVQASMGSLGRVEIVYKELATFLKATNLPSYIADMDGENVYAATLPKDAVLIMGNEANGVSDALKNLVRSKVSIPRFGAIQQTESLNVATATAILLSEFKRS
jgi:TrmH family RNA methyltransferase